MPWLRRAAKLTRLLPHACYRRGLRFGVAAAIEHAGVVARLKPQLVIDAGANIGQFSLLARHEAHRARIVAFEPLPEPAARYRRLFADDPLVTLHPCALGPQTGQAQIHVSAKADSSSLLPISEEQVRRFPGTQEVAVQTIEIAPLTQFLSAEDIPPASLLKIDVQGFEGAVLDSAGPLLGVIRWIYVELSFLRLYEGQPLADDVKARLAKDGFREIGVHNLVHGADGQPLQADFLFERD
jgi:FkbM family methyltransferase